MQFDELRARLKAKPSGKDFSGRCPAHDDRRNSLKLKRGDKRAFVDCYAGCDEVAICAAANLTVDDLFFDSTNGFHPNGNGRHPQPTTNPDKPKWRIESHSDGEIPKELKLPDHAIAELYEYRDETGALRYERVRFEPKAFRPRQPNGKGGWFWDLHGVKEIPYRLPELIAALAEKSARFILLTEGEKDCDRLRSLNFTASSFKPWQSDFNRFIAGANVVLLADHDRAGERLAESAVQKIKDAAASLRVIDLFADEPLPEKHGRDVSDWLADGHTASELQKIIRDAPLLSKPNPPVLIVNGGESDAEEISLPVLSNTALCGLAGDIVRTIEPHTESDNAALLIQLLSGFGNLINRTAYFRAENDSHYTKINVVLVGASSKGRKGSSFGHIRGLLTRVDPSFADCIQDGLSSGEGLIYHVRDKQEKKVAVKDKGRIIDYQNEVVDEGASEKRAFVVEPEFARVLQVMRREGNTLSSIIRQAWDSDRLSVMKVNSLKASGTQISIVGHITRDELRRNLEETETANGFANRFLWTFTKRSKLLPEGGNLQESDLNFAVEKLREAFEFAKTAGELRRNAEAREKWFDIYSRLSSGAPGLLGSVTSRAESQTMRLACVFAVLDCSNEIRLEHLNAALAVWQYCEDSARYIFGNRTGDRRADEIFEALQGAGDDGLDKTQIRDLFSRHAKPDEINRALKMLLELGKIEQQKEQTGGRPREIFKILHCAKSDKSDKTIQLNADQTTFVAKNAFIATEAKNEKVANGKLFETKPIRASATDNAAPKPTTYKCEGADCAAQIPLDLDDCPTCGKRQIDF
jgi:hypothetical protein